MNQTKYHYIRHAIIFAISLKLLLAKKHYYRPIKRLTGHVRKVSEGDLTSTLEVKSKDELVSSSQKALIK
ncbi:HAMP domain-containing protein [Bacillus pumilus]|nr:HAMP domain-containing protein [Bacillus pumilus]